MRRPLRLLLTAPLVLLLGCSLPSMPGLPWGAEQYTRPPVRDCGNVDRGRVYRRGDLVWEHHEDSPRIPGYDHPFFCLVDDCPGYCLTCCGWESYVDQITILTSPN